MGGRVGTHEQSQPIHPDPVGWLGFCCDPAKTGSPFIVPGTWLKGSMPSGPSSRRLWSLSLLVRPAERLARRVDAIDEPGPRSQHTSPTPRMSGLAILIGIQVAGWIWLPISTGDAEHPARGLRRLLVGAPMTCSTCRPGSCWASWGGDDPGGRRGSIRPT